MYYIEDKSKNRSLFLFFKMCSVVFEKFVYV